MVMTLETRRGKPGGSFLIECSWRWALWEVKTRARLNDELLLGPRDWEGLSPCEHFLFSEYSYVLPLLLLYSCHFLFRKCLLLCLQLTKILRVPRPSSPHPMISSFLAICCVLYVDTAMTLSPSILHSNSTHSCILCPLHCKLLEGTTTSSYCNSHTALHNVIIQQIGLWINGKENEWNKVTPLDVEKVCGQISTRK